MCLRQENREPTLELPKLELAEVLGGSLEERNGLSCIAAFQLNVAVPARSDGRVEGVGRAREPALTRFDEFVFGPFQHHSPDIYSLLRRLWASDPSECFQPDRRKGRLKIGRRMESCPTIVLL